MLDAVVLKEEGCGIGCVVKNLSQFYPKLAKEMTGEERYGNTGDVTKIIFADLDSEMLDLCRITPDLCIQVDTFEKKSSPGFIPGKYSEKEILFEPGTMVVTHGVLEHFSDPDITRILSTYEDSYVSFQAHYVPTSGYRNHHSGMNVSFRLITGVPW